MMRERAVEIKIVDATIFGWARYFSATQEDNQKCRGGDLQDVKKNQRP